MCNGFFIKELANKNIISLQMGVLECREKKFNFKLLKHLVKRISTVTRVLVESITEVSF